MKADIVRKIAELQTQYDRFKSVNNQVMKNIVAGKINVLNELLEEYAATHQEGGEVKKIRKGCPTCKHDDYNSGRKEGADCPHSETCGPAFKHWEEYQEGGEIKAVTDGEIKAAAKKEFGNNKYLTPKEEGFRAGAKWREQQVQPKAVSDVRFEITSSHRRYKSDYGIYMWIGKDLYSISALSLEDAKEKKHRLESAWLQQTKAVTDGEIEEAFDKFESHFVEDYAGGSSLFISRKEAIDWVLKKLREQQGDGAKERYEKAQKFLDLNWDGISNKEQVIERLIRITSGYR